MTETLTATANVPQPNFIARMVGVIFSPQETFAAVVARPRWLGVLLVTLVIGAACQYVIMSSPDMQGAIVDQQIRAAAERGATMSDEQIANTERFMANLGAIYAGVTFVLGPLFVAIIAGILFWIFTTMMGGSGTFKQVFAVMVHSGVVSTLAGMLSAGMILAGVPPSGVRPPGANLGVFVPMLEETSFVTILLMSIDLILVWWLITLAIGLAVLYKRRPGNIAMSLLGIYLVIALLIATFSSGA